MDDILLLCSAKLMSLKRLSGFYITFNRDDDDLQSISNNLKSELHASASGAAALPADEAPPPYTPPRIISDSINNNMDCIDEGSSSEGEEGPEVPPFKPETTKITPLSEPTYDFHPAFNRSPQSAHKDIAKDVKPRNESPARPANSRAAERFSPHTPPG